MSNAKDTPKPPATPVMVGEPWRIKIEGKQSRTLAKFRCECGQEFEAIVSNVKTGETKSCGCWQRACTIARSTKHGGGTTRLYKTWAHMLDRCENNKIRSYKDYGGRGIRVCEAWHDFTAFRAWALANGYADHLTIDRVKNDGNYEPGNCRWATRKEQNRNSRRNRLLTIGGETLCLAEWAERTGIKPGTIHTRLKLGWPAERAIKTPT